jgi:hypothetical protein
MSNNNNAAFLNRKWLAKNSGCFTSLFLIGAQVQDHYLVLFIIHLFLEIRLQPYTVNVFEHTEENRKLPGLTVSLEDPVYTPQSFLISDVITN